jgi:hypothetical protein
MKRITLFLLVVFAGFLAFSQGPGDPTEFEKLQTGLAEKNAEVSKVPSMERAPFSQNAIEPGFVQKGFSGKSVGYGWNAYGASSGVPEGPVTVALASGSIASIQAVDDEIVWMAGGDFAGDLWYTVSYNATNSGLYTVDPANGNYTLVGSTGYSMTGLAFDPENEVMYASAYDGANSRLYTVNLQTGAATLVGTIGPGIIIGIAADIDGNLFGLNLDDNLYSINATTGAGTVIGPIGFVVNYAQDIGFDRDNGILYGTLYTTTGGFYQFNLATGAATLINNFGAEVCAFGVPYTSADDAAPAAVADFSITAGAMGVLQASLAWTNPSTTVDGETLTELTSIVIERGGVVIETIANPTIGGAGTFVDDDIDLPGIYNYRIFGVNPAGEGLKVSQSVYVGEDVPAAPAAVVLVAQGNDGYLTWEAPTEGLNGGYFQTTGITYNIVRHPGAVVVATGHTLTSFLDNNITQVGVYYYTVQAVNAVGTGGMATSNATLLGAEGVVFMMNGEVTSCEGTFYDSGGPSGDYQNNENFTLTFFPETEGAKMRFNFTAFNVEPSTTGCWDALEVFDGPNTQAPLVGQFCGITVPALLAELTSTHSTGAITFRFTSDGSVPRPGWQASFTCYIPSENDLRATAISGNTTPSVGAETIYNITVFNEGSADQLGSSYTVELKDAAHNVLASVPGVDIASGVVLQVPVTWAPSAEGPMSIYGFVNFAGDQVPANNSTPMLNISVQPAEVLVITIGTATTFPTSRMPWDFYWKNSISQTLYFPEEIGVGGGAILSVGYKNNFVTNLPGKAVKIWLGETEANDLTGGWVDPSTLTLVYDGTVDFPNGINDIVIPLQTPYVYTGGNLVIYSLRVWEDAYFSSNDRFYGTEDAGSNRTRRAAADATVYDPTAPPATSTLVSWHPNTTLYFSTAGLGAIEGTVTDGTDPVEGVKVSVLGTMASTHTNADGFYEFPFLLPGTYDVEFEIFGYVTHVEEDVVVEAEETTVLDVEIEAISNFNVTGIVVGNDDLPIEGASVMLVGYDNYQVVTSATGAFTVEDVFQGTYVLTVSAMGYESFTNEALVVDQHLNLGEIELIEIIVAPFGLMVVEGPQAGEASFSWNNATGWGESFEGAAVPEGWARVINNSGTQAGFPCTWTITGTVALTTPIVPQSGNYQAFMMWSYNHQDEWLITPEFIAPSGDLVFWYYGTNGSTNADNYYVKVSTDGGANWTILWNASALPAGANSYQTPAVINMSAYAGQNIHIAWNNVDGPGNDGLWFAWAIDNISVGDMKIDVRDLVVATGGDINTGVNLASRDGAFYPSVDPADMLPSREKAFVGYNVYLNDLTTPVATSVATTEFLFTGLANGDYVAGVQSVYTSGASEVVTVPFTITNGVVVETYEVTFNVHMHAISFDPATDAFYITGDLFDWASPGSLPEQQTLTVTDDPNIYTITMELDAGTYLYKFFKNSGWNGGEWPGDPNRELLVDEDMVVDHVFGNIDDPVNVPVITPGTLSIYPNPARDILHIVSGETIREVRMVDMLGQVVYSFNVQDQRHELNVGGFRNGIYFVQVLTAKGLTTQRIQIVK